MSGCRTFYFVFSTAYQATLPIFVRFEGQQRNRVPILFRLTLI